MTERWLTTEEVAEVLRTTPAAIYAMTHRKQGPPSAQVGKRRLFPESRVEEWLAARLETNTRGVADDAEAQG